MIDFGDCGESPSCLDPVTLEMSVLFHKDRPGDLEWFRVERFALSGLTRGASLRRLHTQSLSWLVVLGRIVLQMRELALSRRLVHTLCDS